MKDPVVAIKTALGPALVDTCKKGGCKVVLNGKFPRSRALVDMDHRSLGLTSETRCDYLFIAGSRSNCWVVPIELTRGGNKDAQQVKGQLNAGASFAYNHLPRSITVQLLPVFAHRGTPAAELRMLKRSKIKFGNQSEFTKIIRCGDPLSNALKQK